MAPYTPASKHHIHPHTTDRDLIEELRQGINTLADHKTPQETRNHLSGTLHTNLFELHIRLAESQEGKQ